MIDSYPLNLTEVMLPIFACFCRNFMCLFFEKTVNFVKRRFFVKMMVFSPFRGRGGFWAKRVGRAGKGEISRVENDDRPFALQGFIRDFDKIAIVICSCFERFNSSVNQ